MKAAAMRWRALALSLEGLGLLWAALAACEDSTPPPEYAQPEPGAWPPPSYDQTAAAAPAPASEPAPTYDQTAAAPAPSYYEQSSGGGYDSYAAQSSGGESYGYGNYEAESSGVDDFLGFVTDVAGLATVGIQAYQAIATGDPSALLGQDPSNPGAGGPSGGYDPNAPECLSCGDQCRGYQDACGGSGGQRACYEAAACVCECALGLVSRCGGDAASLQQCATTNRQNAAAMGSQ